MFSLFELGEVANLIKSLRAREGERARDSNSNGHSEYHWANRSRRICSDVLQSLNDSPSR